METIPYPYRQLLRQVLPWLLLQICQLKKGGGIIQKEKMKCGIELLILRYFSLKMRLISAVHMVLSD